jgi:fructose-1,6-bisphosphatase/inositol monophosphatase family enzyme
MSDIDPKKIDSIIRHVAATEVMPRFKNLHAGEFREKNPDDFVTIADELSEKALSRLLTEALPGSLVVGEEAVSADKSVLDRLKGDAPVWVIDPIDGTYNFLHGRSKFGILIALVQRGVTQYGWAYDVPGDRMAWAKLGGGAWLDGAQLKIACGKTDLSEMTGQGGGAQAWHFEPLKPHIREMINVRCSLHDFMSFYAGTADFVLHTGKSTPWDQAAGCLIAEEAGGYVAIDGGAPFDPTVIGSRFLIAAPTKEWWDKLYPVLHDNLMKKKPC